MVARTPRGVEEFATPFRRNLPQRLALELSLKFVRVHFDGRGLANAASVHLISSYRGRSRSRNLSKP